MACFNHKQYKSLEAAHRNLLVCTKLKFTKQIKKNRKFFQLFQSSTHTLLHSCARNFLHLFSLNHLLVRKPCQSSSEKTKKAKTERIQNTKGVKKEPGGSICTWMEIKMKIQRHCIKVCVRIFQKIVGHSQASYKLRCVYRYKNR